MYLNRDEVFKANDPGEMVIWIVIMSKNYFRTFLIIDALRRVLKNPYKNRKQPCIILLWL